MWERPLGLEELVSGAQQSFGLLALHALAEAIGLAQQLDDLRMVCQPVK
jgi:hypothetical protein